MRPCGGATGSTFLVAWSDFRNNPTTFREDVYGTRVSGAGAVLNPSGIAISTAADRQYDPGGRLERHELLGHVERCPNLGSSFDIYAAKG